MKASELRLGNYVRLMLNHSDYNEFAIELPDFNLIANNSLNHTYEPIPLTEEWMLKFGFVIRYFNQDETKPLFWKVEKNRHIDIYPHKEHNFYFFINSIQMSTPLKYVHQLQNLYFALTGEELTVKQ